MAEIVVRAGPTVPCRSMVASITRSPRRLFRCGSGLLLVAASFVNHWCSMNLDTRRGVPYGFTEQHCPTNFYPEDPPQCSRPAPRSSAPADGESVTLHAPSASALHDPGATVLLQPRRAPDAAARAGGAAASPQPRGRAATSCSRAGWARCSATTSWRPGRATSSTSRAASGTRSGTRATSPRGILEIISPAGFEQFFAELALGPRAAASPNPEAMGELCARYVFERQPDSVAELCARFGVWFPGAE